jgi:hypothetical protein
METKQYRHGEILLQQVETIPEGAIARKTNVVATGKTGHDHRLTGGQILEPNTPDGGTTSYIDITADGAGIDHDEHGKIALAAGEKYEVIRQREFDPYADAARQVED